MSKIAFTALLNRTDTVLSPHFGKAKWILLRDQTGNVVFEQNFGLNGHAVVDILRRAGCTDVVSAEVGEGAYRQLLQAGIRGWAAPGDLPVPKLAEMLAHGELSPLTPKPHGSGGCCHGDVLERKTGRGKGHSGCCCG